MALNPTGQISLGNVNTELGLSTTAQISLGATGVRTLYNIASGAIRLAADGYGKSNSTATQKAIFAYGQGPTNNTANSISNLVSSTGVVATDTPGVGTARIGLAASGYGTDKAIFGFGVVSPAAPITTLSITNLVSNTGVVATDTAGVPGVTTRYLNTGARYGGDKAIFGYGRSTAAPKTVLQSKKNLVSNTGVVAADTPGVGTARGSAAGAGYGTDKAIFGFGGTPAQTNITNLVSNTGVVATDTPGVGTVRSALAAAGYGGDKAIFAYGASPAGFQAMSNLVSNTGVVATDTAGVGQVRASLGAAGYSLT